MTALSPRVMAAAHSLASIEATLAAGRYTATEARQAKADVLNELSAGDRHAARMEARRIVEASKAVLA